MNESKSKLIFNKNEMNMVVNSHSSNVLLLFPPGWSLQSPYLSIPILSSFLKSNNVNTKSIDLNIEIFTSILTEETIQKSMKDIEAMLKTETGVDKFKELTLCMELYNLIPNNLDKEIKTLLSDTVDPECYIRINQLIEVAFRIYSAPYFPGRINNGCFIKLKKFIPYSNVPNEDIEKFDTFTKVIEAFKNQNQNPLWKIIESYINELQIIQYNIVGISICNYPQLVTALCCAYFVKQKNDKCLIVIGGAIMPYIIPILKENLEIFQYVDYIVNGEGELPLLDICHHFNNREKIEKIEGLVYYDNKNKIVRENKNQTCIDLNLLSPPDYDDYDLSKYLIPSSHLSLSVMGTRGCYWNKCAFCGVNCNYGKVRSRSKHLISKDLDILSEKYHINNFRFIDNCIHPKDILDISTEFIKERKNYRWQSMVRFDNKFSKEIWEYAYSAGLRVVSFGLESCNQKILDQMNKGIDASVIPHILWECHNAKIFTHCFFIVGFPCLILDNEVEVEETVDFIKTNRYSIDSVTFTKFRIESQSYIFKNMDKYNLKLIGYYPADYISPNYEYQDFCNADEKMNLIRNEIANLTCSEYCFSSLSDMYVIGCTFNDITPLKNWLKYKINQYEKVKCQIDNMNLNLSEYVQIIEKDDFVLLISNNNYWIFNNKSILTEKKNISIHSITDEKDIHILVDLLINTL